MVLFGDDNRTVFANEGSEYFDYLGCDPVTNNTDNPCQGSVIEFVSSFFGGKFRKEHIPFNAIILAGILVVARVSTFLALKYLKFAAT